MNLSSKNKISPEFSMASMTDLIFLLLVFFMLTSSFVTPSGLPVSLPSSQTSNIEVQKVSDHITKDMQNCEKEKSDKKAMIEEEIRRKK
jgi:biopolymer transport protein ExbD